MEIFNVEIRAFRLAAAEEFQEEKKKVEEFNRAVKREADKKEFCLERVLTPNHQIHPEYFSARVRAFGRKKLKNLDIFARRYLLFNKHMVHDDAGHWILVVVKNPAFIFKNQTSKVHTVCYCNI